MKKLLTTSLLILGYANLLAQSNILNADRPDEIGKKTEAQQIYDDAQSPLKHPFVQDKDVLWSKIVYEEIDLSQKFNFPLLFPTDDQLYAEERKSLWRIISEAIISEKINNVYVDNNANFREKLSQDQYLSRIENRVVINDREAIDRVASYQITAYKIKGMWYFDKKFGELRYRLLGIMPVGRDLLNENDTDFKTGLFWLWYKDLRPILHKEYVLDERNNANRISFDQLLTSRRFTSRIYAVDNVYNDRGIDKYVDDPFLQLLESERLKNLIRDFEHDMWSY